MQTRWIPVIFLLGWMTSVVADDDCSNASVAEAKALALKAAAQVEEFGHERAFRNFMDPTGEFFPRDLYVFVVDMDGLVWVNGAYPQIMGSNAMDAEDGKGRRYIEQMIRIAAERGEGRIEYQWVSPCTGEYSNKVTFFKRVGRFVIAVGAYVSSTSAKTSSPALPNGAQAPAFRAERPIARMLLSSPLIVQPSQVRSRVRFQ